MRMNSSWFVRLVFLQLFSVILAARAGAAAPAGGNPQTWVLWHHRVVEAAAAASPRLCRVLGPKLVGALPLLSPPQMALLPHYPAILGNSGKEHARSGWQKLSQNKCGSPQDKGLMCVSQTLIARWLWSQPRAVGNKRQELCDKEQDVAGERALQKWGSTFLGQTPLVWLLEISTTQCKHRNELEKWVWTVGGIKTTVESQSLRLISRKV